MSPNRQTPHSQDEVYVIARGRGVLFHDGRQDQFEAGDFIFVAAGVEHWFEDFTDDLAVWVVFYGRREARYPRRARPHAFVIDFQCVSRSAISSARFRSSRPSRMLRSSESARKYTPDVRALTVGSVSE